MDDGRCAGHGPCCSHVRMESPRVPRTHCPYCALQCGMHVSAADGRTAITGNPKFPVNEGGLCAKGWSAADTLRHPERLLTPLARDANDRLAPVEWDEALERVTSAFRRIRDTYGRDAIGVFGGGSLTNEKAYLLGKFARVALGTANIDYNGRFCMSSAAAAAIARLRHRSRPAVSARRHPAARGRSAGRRRIRPRRCRRSCSTSRRSSATAAR